MSKTKKGGSGGGRLGRSLVKERNRSKRSGRGGETWLHSSEVGDGYEWGRLNLQSVTEQSRLDEFLSTAELAGTEFTAEKLNIKVVDPGSYTGLPTRKETEEMELAQLENKQFLNIPRRPQWDADTTAEKLDQLEREGFLEWRRQLAQLQENERLVVTPFEKNLEFWRQLWRVIERSDVVVQIVDARNPLLFRCEDLEKYVIEVDSKKVNMLLISKADLLTSKQRQAWKKYFETETSLNVAFWSALEQSEQEDTSIPNSSSISHSDSTSDTVQEDTSSDLVDKLATELHQTGISHQPSSTDQVQNGSPPHSVGEQTTMEQQELVLCDKEDVPPSTEDERREEQFCICMKDNGELHPRLLTRDELIEQLLSISPVSKGEVTTVGMVGYPNVGKSSTINALFQGKKVPVSATPGRTKHFQTLYVADDLMLCDCPGLVYPNFVSSKAEMICNGILPIDQMRDHVPAVSLVCQRIPRHVLEATYGIRLPEPSEGEDPERLPYYHELLDAYGYMRGFMTHHGRPDNPRSARYILKDYVNGKLLYCHPPPGVEPRYFNDQLTDGEVMVADEVVDKAGEVNASDGDGAAKPAIKSEFDNAYFKQESVRAVIKGSSGFVRRTGEPVRNYSNSNSMSTDSGSNVPESDSASFAGSSVSEAVGKPWKKHNNRNKKEKIRRTQ